MSLVALHTVLRDGRETEYDEVHARIPDDLMEAHRRAGIRDWRIWRSGRNCFHLVECDDFPAAIERLDGDPANVRWQAFIREYVDHLEPGGPDDPTLPLVWQMRAQDEG
jgi:L-rhamnose mutarotase